MRLRLLPLLLAGAACGESGPEPPFIDAFIARAVPLRCTPRPDLNPDELAVSDVVTADDSLLLILHGEGRIEVFDPRLRPVRRLRLPPAGPTGVREPVSVAAGPDGTIYVAELSGGSIRKLGPEGEARGSVRAEFGVHRVRAAGDRIYVAPLVFGSLPGRLLYRVDADSVLPLDVDVIDFGELSKRALGNMTAFAPLAGGRWLLAHAFLTSRAVVGDSSGPLREAVLPVPDAARRAFAADPPAMLTEAAMAHLATAAVDAVGIPGTSDVLYLTRSGRVRPDAAPEKALIRVDSRLAPVRWHVLGPNAVRLALLGGRIVLVDREDRFHVCEDG